MKKNQKLFEEIVETKRKQWAKDQLADARWQDKRHGKRAESILQDLAAHPDCHLTAVSANPAKTRGAYRLMENDRVTPQIIWEGVFGSTARKIPEGQRILAIQDTSFLVFDNREGTAGLGTSSQAKADTLCLHWGLAASEEGHLYGAIYSEVWARPLSEFGKRARCHSTPFEQKESYKWVGCARQLQARPELAGHRLVHIGDRESDVFEILHALLEQLGHDVVIRCAHPERELTEGRKLREAMKQQPILECRTISIPRRGNSKARQATVELRSAAVTLAVPANCLNHSLGPLPIHVVGVYEPSPPAGSEPVNWMLLTNLPTDTPAHCWEVVELYKRRWLIEEVHLVLKNGLKIENTQLKTAQRIEKLLAFCVAVSVQIVQLRQWVRLEPEAPCTVVLSQDQYRVLHAYRTGKPYPSDRPPPTVREAIQWIGQLGGHLGRKCDGTPGVRTLWRGWCQLEILILGYRAAQQVALAGPHDSG